MVGPANITPSQTAIAVRSILAFFPESIQMVGMGDTVRRKLSAPGEPAMNSRCFSTPYFNLYSVWEVAAVQDVIV